MTITHISFDLDDTLTPEQFDTIMWNEEIPAIYAKQFGVTIQQAKEKVYAQYYATKYLEHVPNWTDIQMHFERLGLHDWQSVLDDLGKRLQPFDDVIATLTELQAEYTLVIITLNEQKMLDAKLDATGLRKYFAATFSAPTDLGERDKTPQIYVKTIDCLGIDKDRIVHIGNDELFDYKNPTSAGIKAVLLDRTGKKQGEQVIHSLRELKDRL
jgi:putative hydrolase of the HAD superfamily